MTDILKAIQEKVAVLNTLDLSDVSRTLFTASGSDNEKASIEADFNLAMAERILCSHLKSVVEKRYDKAKELMDKLGASLGIDAVTVFPGSRQVVYEDNVFLFQKMVKRSASSLDVTKLKINLARQGLDGPVIDKIIEDSSVERTPQTIYEIIPKV